MAVFFQAIFIQWLSQFIKDFVKIKTSNLIKNYDKRLILQDYYGTYKCSRKLRLINVSYQINDFAPQSWYY